MNINVLLLVKTRNPIETIFLFAKKSMMLLDKAIRK